MHAKRNKQASSNSNPKTSNKLKALSKALILAGIVGGIALPVAAKDYRHGNNGNNNVAYDYAKVVNVEPVIESHQVNQPVEKCWDERVSSRNSYSDRRGNNQYGKSYTGEIFGALIGAAAGNKFGRGRGRKIATVAGAVLGGSVARDIKNRSSYSRADRNDRSYEVVQRCELRDSYTTQEQVVGYDVAYKFRGNVFHTQMNQHPGDQIKVMVTVNPV